jgi:hypothetical protein
MFTSTEDRLIYPYKQVLGTVSLSAEKRQLFEERYLRLLKTSFGRCRKIALVYNCNRLTITIGSILVPAILSIQRTDYLSADPAEQTLFWLTWVVSLMVTVSNGLMTMFKFDRKYYLFHAAFEQLKTEGWQYLALTGNYKGTEPLQRTHEIQFGTFAHTVERIRMRQTEEEYVRLQDVAGIRQVAAGLSGATTGGGPAAAIPTVFDYGKTPGRDDLLQSIWTYLKGQQKTENSVVETGDAPEHQQSATGTGTAATSPGGQSQVQTVWIH